MYKSFTSCLLIISILGLIIAPAFAEPLTATDRVKNLANEEGTWRWIAGGTKVVVGAVISGVGYSLASYRDNFFGMLALLPIGLSIMVPGVVVFGWGAFDLLFGSREYENKNDQLSKIVDTDRETQAVDYLKTKAAKDKQDRQPSFWNAFGLFSMFETPAEREYKAYLKDRGNF